MSDCNLNTEGYFEYVNSSRAISDYRYNHSFNSIDTSSTNTRIPITSLGTGVKIKRGDIVCRMYRGSDRLTFKDIINVKTNFKPKVLNTPKGLVIDITECIIDMLAGAYDIYIQFRCDEYLKIRINHMPSKIFSIPSNATEGADEFDDTYKNKNVDCTDRYSCCSSENCNVKVLNPNTGCFEYVDDLNFQWTEKVTYSWVKSYIKTKSPTKIKIKMSENCNE